VYKILQLLAVLPWKIVHLPVSLVDCDYTGLLRWKVTEVIHSLILLVTGDPKA